jgi:hypothetical protein
VSGTFRGQIRPFSTVGGQLSGLQPFASGCLTLLLRKNQSKVC